MGDSQNSDQAQPQPSTQGAHEAPSSAAQRDTREQVKVVLENHIGRGRRGLRSRFFKDVLDTAHIDQATEMFTKLSAKGCPKEQAQELSILVLYDIVILLG